VAHRRLPKLKLTHCSQTDKSTPQQKRAKIEDFKDLNVDLQMPGGRLHTAELLASSHTVFPVVQIFAVPAETSAPFCHAHADLIENTGSVLWHGSCS
jgi:hypothetical protein